MAAALIVNVFDAEATGVPVSDTVTTISKLLENRLLTSGAN